MCLLVYIANQSDAGTPPPLLIIDGCRNCNEAAKHLIHRWLSYLVHKFYLTYPQGLKYGSCLIL